MRGGMRGVAVHVPCFLRVVVFRFAISFILRFAIATRRPISNSPCAIARGPTTDAITFSRSVVLDSASRERKFCYRLVPGFFKLNYARGWTVDVSSVRPRDAGVVRCRGLADRMYLHHVLSQPT